MKKKSTLILLSGLLLGLVSCGGNTTSTAGGPSTQNPTSPITSPTNNDSSLTDSGTSDKTSTPDSTPTPGGDPATETYYNPESTYYKVPKSVSDMYTAFTSANEKDATGFAATLIGIQQYNGSSTANLFFANGAYGFRVNSGRTDLIIGKSYVVTGPKHGSNSYEALDGSLGSQATPKPGIEAYVELADVIPAPTIDLGSYEDAVTSSVSCAVTFTNAEITAIIPKEETQSSYPGITVTYNSKSFNLTYPYGTGSYVTTAADIYTKLAGVHVGQRVSGKVIRSGATQYTILQADDITLTPIVAEDVFFTASKGSGDNQDGSLSFTPSNTLVTIGASTQTLKLYEPLTSSSAIYKVAVDFTRPTAITSWDGITIKIDDAEPVAIADASNTTDKVSYSFDFTQTKKEFNVNIAYNNPFYNDYSTKIKLSDDVSFEALSDYDALPGTLAVVEDVPATFANNELIVGSTDTSSAATNEINYYPPTHGEAGNYIDLRLTAPDGFVPGEAIIKITIAGNEVLNKSGNEIPWTTQPVNASDTTKYTYDCWTKITESMIPVSGTSSIGTIVATWKNNTKPQTINISLRSTLTLAINTLATSVPLATVTFPQETSAPGMLNFTKVEATDSATITATGTVPYYQADLSAGRAEGNRVGILFQAPEAYRNTNAEPKITIYRNGAIHNGIEDQPITYEYPSTYQFEWYPLITEDMLPTDGQPKEISTVKITWATDAREQEYKIYLGANTTLQSDPMAPRNGVITSFDNNGIQNTISGTNVTFTATTGKAEIPYYPADESIHRTAGNRLGVNITAPTLSNYAAAKVTITRNGEIHNSIENVAVTYDNATNHSFEWWPEIDQATLDFAEKNGGLFSTVSVVWAEGTKAQVFNLYLSGTFTLEPMPVNKFTLDMTKYAAGTQYAKEEEHILNENLTIVTNDAHFAENDIRLYHGRTNTGYVDLICTGRLMSIVINLDNSINTIKFQASADGANWTDITTVTPTSNAKADYNIDLSKGTYNRLRITVNNSPATSGRVDINTMVVSYLD